MLKILLCFLTLIITATSSNTASVLHKNKLNITVKYNPLSSVSKKFINEQFYPVWFTNKNLINLQLLPIGLIDRKCEVEMIKSSEDDEKRTHACVLKLFSINTAFPIIDCLLVNRINLVNFHYLNIFLKIICNIVKYFSALIKRFKNLLEIA